MNAIPKYVVSRTLSGEEASSRWNNTTLLGGDGAIDAIRRLRTGRATAASRSGAVRRSPGSSSRTTWWTSTA